MKQYITIVSVLLGIAILCGCSTGKEDSVTDTSVTGNHEAEAVILTPQPEAVSTEALAEESDVAIITEQPLSEEEQQHMDMLKRSLISTGNTERIHRAIQKAQNDEKVTIAYLGGSITQGVGANPENENCYAALSAKLFAEQFAKEKDNVTYINAGIAGTPSLLGITRCNKDIISYEPDIVFVEFAVNDGTDAISREAYESLVRKLLNSESQPAVILIFSVLSNGYSAQDTMQKTGVHYDLGMISVKDAITPELDAGRMQFLGEYAVDEAHPSNYGHNLMAEFIGYYFEEAVKNESTPYTIPEKPQYKASLEKLENITKDSEEIVSYGDFRYGSLTCFTYDAGWKRNKKSENKPMVLEIECSKLTIAYQQFASPDNGAVDVYVDGKLYTTLYGYQQTAWGNVATELLVLSGTSSKHSIELKMADGDENRTFTLLGIGYVE